MRRFATGCAVVLAGVVTTQAQALDFWERLEPDQQIELAGWTSSELQLVDAGDLNGDGYGDVAVSYARLLGVYQGSAQGLVLWQELAVSTDTPLAAGDLNADGYDDLIFRTDGVSLQAYKGTPEGLDLEHPWTLRPGDDQGLGAVVCAPGDVTGDGYEDIVVSTDDRGFLLFAGGTEGPSYQGHYAVDSVTPGRVLPAGDVDGDGYQDLTIPGDQTTLIYFGSQAGFQADTQRLELNGGLDATYAYAVSTDGDLDGDGRPELVASDSRGLVIRVFPNVDGAYAWSTASRLAGSSQAFGQAMSMGDLDADGFDELAAGAPGGQGLRGQVHVFAGGAAGAGAHGLTALAGEPGDQLGQGVLVAGDVNGDGYRDLIATTTAPELWLWYGGAWVGAAR